MQDNELSEFFLKIKGIGPWTLGIIKMFYLGHSRYLFKWRSWQ